MDVVTAINAVLGIDAKARPTGAAAFARTADERPLATAIRSQATPAVVSPLLETAVQKASPSEYSVTVVSSFAQWAELAEGWNALLAQSRANAIFLTWEWLSAWADCFWAPDCQLFVLTVFRAGKLVGIAPWCIRLRSAGIGTVRQIEFLSSSDVGSDYLDVFAKPGKERDVARRIYDFLFGEARSRWDSLGLKGIPADSLFLLHLLDKGAEDGKHVHIETGAFCPSVPLPATKFQLLAGLSQNRREQFRRHHRLLIRAGTIEHTTVTSRDGFDATILDTLFDLYTRKSGTELAQHCRFLRRFVAGVQGKDWVQIDVLTVDRTPVAAFLHLRYGVSVSLYLVATDKSACRSMSVGNVFIGLCLQDAIERNFREYDFLQGSEAYKFHWATGGKRSLNVRMDQGRFPVLCLIGLTSVKTLLKVALR